MGETGVGCRVQSNFMLASLRMAQSNSCRNKPELLMGSLNSRLLSPATVTATTAIASMAHFHFLPEMSFALELMNRKKKSVEYTYNSVPYKKGCQSKLGNGIQFCIKNNSFITRLHKMPIHTPYISIIIHKKSNSVISRLLKMGAQHHSSFGLRLRSRVSFRKLWTYRVFFNCSALKMTRKEKS